MFEGKILRVAIGTPRRMIARANRSLADADPDPFTLANLTTKSLTALIALDMATSLRRVEQEFLHVPCARQTALGAQAAMQTNVFVLHHHPASLQCGRHIEILHIAVQ